MMSSIQRLSALVLAGTLCAASPALAQFNAFKDPSPSAGGSGTSAGPDIKAVAPTVDGGKVKVGGTTYVVAMFRNNGTSPVKVTGINLYPSSSVSTAVSLNKCAEAPLPPDAQCAVTVAVTGLQIGSWRVEVLLDHDGRSRLATAALQGNVEGGGSKELDEIKADVEATPEILDFGTATGGVPLVRGILLRNRTSEKVTLGDMEFDAPPNAGFAMQSQCPESLAPGESCVVSVTWSPVARGASEAVLRVGHSAKSGLTKVDVKGLFDPTSQASAPLYPGAVPDRGLLVASMDRVDFGSNVNGVSAITVSLVNAGSADLELRTVRLAGSDNGLSVLRSGCGAGTILKPVEACALTLNWVPSRGGPVIDDLQIQHTGARGVLILPIRGSAAGPASRESIALRQPSADVQALDAVKGSGKESAMPPDLKDFAKTAREDEYLASLFSDAAPSLDGYTVTSHAPTKAVISGPIGSLVVRDGEDVVISGVRWVVTIVNTGVMLTNDGDEVLLLFDKSLRAMKPAAPTQASAEAPSNEPPAAAAAPAVAAPAQ